MFFFFLIIEWYNHLIFRVKRLEYILCKFVLSCSIVSNSLQSHELQPARLLCPWDSPVKNTGVGCCTLLQGIFPTQGSNPGLLHCRQILYHLSYQDAKESTCNVGDPGLISWRRVWFPTPVFLSGEFHGQTSLVGYSPWACKESDMTEKLTCIIRLIFPPGNSDLKLLFMDQKGHSYFLFSLPV